MRCRWNRAGEKGNSVISNGCTLEQPVEAEKHVRQGKETLVEELDEMDEDLRLPEEPPGWLPDGWIMEVCRDDSGSIYRCYTSPVSGCTFTSKLETLEYLFSGIEERMLESHESAEDNELLGSHTWLPGGWLIEVRAGGKKMNKMYKFYFHPPTGMRFLSKAEVLHYVNEGKISASDIDVLCDTQTDDNILAHVEFNPDGLPDGWVKETIFRNCNDGIRKDPYYTDPISRRVFRTLKSVLSYLGTGEMSKHAYLPRRNVIDMYSFDKCVDLPQSMLRRLRAGAGQTKQKSRRALVLYRELLNNQTPNHSEGGTSAGLTPKSNSKRNMFGTDKGTTTNENVSETTKRRRGRPKKIEATTTNENVSETTKRRRGRPQKILKQTNESISDCDKRHNEAKHNEVKEEVDIGGEEDTQNGKTKEHTEIHKRTTIIQEVENNNNIAERNPLKRKEHRSNLVAGLGLQNQENGRSTEAGEKATCSSAHKFYKRRCSNQTVSSNK